MSKTREEIKKELRQEQQAAGAATDSSEAQINIDASENEMSSEMLQMQLLNLMSENHELNNRLLRLQADFENFKRRTRSERDEFANYAYFELLQKLLPILDNFERAILSNEEQGEKILQGVTMIYRQLKEILEKEGLQEIKSVGEQFDPNLHDAVMRESSDEYAENTITGELQKGYLFKDKLLRPSMVKVCQK